MVIFLNGIERLNVLIVLVAAQNFIFVITVDWLFYFLLIYYFSWTLFYICRAYHTWFLFIIQFTLCVFDVLFVFEFRTSFCLFFQKWLFFVKCLILNRFCGEPPWKYILSAFVFLLVDNTHVWDFFYNWILFGFSIFWLFFYYSHIIFLRLILRFLLKLGLQIFSLVIHYAFKRVSTWC